jgi:gamma-glutamyltranspeptidase/glutathione hydrolase
MVHKHMKYSIILLILIGFCFSREFEPIYGTHGMVVTEDPIASKVGLEILESGGNAFDAAVAVGFALAVSYPQAGNIGGGGFMILYKVGDKVTALDYREKAPGKASKNMYLDDEGNVIPDASTLGYLSAGVPGTVHGLWQVQQKYCSKKWKDLIEPAIRLAEMGYRLDQYNAETLNALSFEFSKFSSTEKIFTKGGQDFKPGDIFKQEDLAKTLKRISKYGIKDFYEGETAKSIANVMHANGGLLSETDLNDYESVWREPIRIQYRDYVIYSMPPPSSGGLVLAEIFNTLENFNLSNLGSNSSDLVRLWTEVEKYAFYDRANWMGDSDFFDVPINLLISKAYAKKISSKINFFNATNSDELESEIPLIPESEHTTHFSIVDQWGNAVSNTYTLNSSFGSKVVIDGTGILMNNEMDDFSIKAGYPNQFGLVGSQANAIEPEKRMLSSMSPSIVTRNDSLFMVIGSPGGSRIISTVAQVISNVIDHKMNIRDAIENPRFHHQWRPDIVYLEKNVFSKDVINNLESRGYNIQLRGSIGSAQGIVRNLETNELSGWSDPRNNGSVESY